MSSRVEKKTAFLMGATSGNVAPPLHSGRRIRSDAP